MWDQNIFMPATNHVYMSSCTLPAANDLGIIEIMSNCNTNSQEHIYSPILQDFSKTLVAEVYIEIHILQTKEFACIRQVKTVEGIAL